MAEFTADFRSTLEQGLRVTGESSDYFARGRVARVLDRVRPAPGYEVLDYGCGDGGTAPILRDGFRAHSVVGFDASPGVLNTAQPQAGLEFVSQLEPGERFHLCYCSGVFHHIPPEQRQDNLSAIYARLRPGGWLALWENNPWNPGTRWVMARLPFDRDAITLNVFETRRRVREAGFTIVAVDFWFVFPRFLAWLRPLEPYLAGLPLGAQYMVLARKPGDGTF